MVDNVVEFDDSAASDAVEQSDQDKPRRRPADQRGEPRRRRRNRGPRPAEGEASEAREEGSENVTTPVEADLAPVMAAASPAAETSRADATTESTSDAVEAQEHEHDEWPELPVIKPPVAGEPAATEAKQAAATPEPVADEPVAAEPAEEEPKVELSPEMEVEAPVEPAEAVAVTREVIIAEQAAEQHAAEQHAAEQQAAERHAAARQEAEVSEEVAAADAAPAAAAQAAAGLTGDGRAVNDPRVAPHPVADIEIATGHPELFGSEVAPPVQPSGRVAPRASNDPRGALPKSAGDSSHGDDESSYAEAAGHH